MSKITSIWERYGISREKYGQCDEAMTHLMRGAALLETRVLFEIVAMEARFQTFELPNRTKKARGRMRWKEKK